MGSEMCIRDRPSCLYLNSDRGILGRTLVKNSSSIPIRLLNPTNKNITIHSGTTVGQLSPVEEILEGGLNDSEPCRTFPVHLDALFKETITKLDKKQANVVKHILCKDDHLFTNSDKDVGRTAMTKHSINTGSHNR